MNRADFVLVAIIIVALIALFMYLTAGSSASGNAYTPGTGDSGYSYCTGGSCPTPTSGSGGVHVYTQ